MVDLAYLALELVKAIRAHAEVAQHDIARNRNYPGHLFIVDWLIREAAGTEFAAGLPSHQNVYG